ncbi:MAG: hypothetical protein DLM53_05300 [Candidatus Eremiobacter antarcticus]|nr:MAG: hypothetical protein DLM53_05300 [Candidatus Eremiobacter sp. RRmetagenome_bin22]
MLRLGRRGALRLVLVLTLVTLMTWSSSKHAPAATPVPEIKADWTSINFRLGTWRCVGQVTGRPGDRLVTSVSRMSLDGHWMLTNSSSPPFDKARSKNADDDTYLGYDAKAQLWMAFRFGNFGDYRWSTSPGWRSDTMLSTNYVLNEGKPVIVGHDTLTKLSDTQTREVSADLRSGVWVETATQTCNKMKAK